MPKLRKPPSFLHRPWLAKRVLEVGAGQLPYEGVTHVVDKFPEDEKNSHGARSGNLWVPEGVEFREGTFEELPYSDSEKFDFLYARHVFEHVTDPVAAVREVNRLAQRGYIETPSPAYEMLCCSYPFNTQDVHYWFVWTNARRNAIHVVKKNEQTVGEFSSSRFGQLAKALTLCKRSDPNQVPDHLLPNRAKTTRLFFNGPIQLTVHQNFEEALSRGEDAFASLRYALPYLRPPVSWFYPRFLPLLKIWSEL